MTTKDDIKLLMESCLTMLKEVNNLSDDYEYPQEYIACSKIIS